MPDNQLLFKPTAPLSNRKSQEKPVYIAVYRRIDGKLMPVIRRELRWL